MVIQTAEIECSSNALYTCGIDCALMSSYFYQSTISIIQSINFSSVLNIVWSEKWKAFEPLIMKIRILRSFKDISISLDAKRFPWYSCYFEMVFGLIQTTEWDDKIVHSITLPFLKTIHARMFSCGHWNEMKAIVINNSVGVLVGSFNRVQVAYRCHLSLF